MSSTFIAETPSITSFNKTTIVPIVVSLAFHGLVLGVAIPHFSPNSDASKPLDVNVIELSEAEASRLPSLSPETLDPTQFPDTSQNTISSLDTPIADPSELTSSLPALPPLSSLTSSPSPSISNIPALPPLNSLPSSVNVYSPPIASLPTPPRDLPRIPELPNSPIDNTQPYPQEDPNNSNLRPQFDPYNPPSLDDLRNAPITQSQQRQQEIQNNQRETARLNPPQEDNQSLQPERTEKILEEWRQRREAIQASLNRDDTNTSPGEATKNDVEWMARNQVVLGKNQNAIALAGNYPRLACARQIQGTGVYGVMVNAQGQVMGSPSVIQSAGYPILNQQAIGQIAGASFTNTTGAPQPYRVTVSFAPNPQVCPPSTLAKPERQIPTQEATKPEPPKVPELNPSPANNIPQNTQQQTPVETLPQQPQQNKPPVAEPSPTPENTQPKPPVVEQSPTPENTQPKPPVVEQSPTPENTQPKPPVVEQAPPPENTQPKPPVVQESPKPVETPSTLAEPLGPPAEKKPPSSDVNPVQGPAGKKPEPPPESTSANPKPDNPVQ